MTNETIEGNRLIAKFMGGEYKEDLPYTWTKTGWINTPANHTKTIAQDYDFEYHKNWNWLMEVVEKCIKEMSDSGIKGRGDWTPEHGYVSDLWSIKLSSPIELVWSEVVKYIKRKK